MVQVMKGSGCWPLNKGDNTKQIHDRPLGSNTQSG